MFFCLLSKIQAGTFLSKCNYNSNSNNNNRYN